MPAPGTLAQARRWALPVACAAFAAGALAPLARAGWWDDLDKGRRISLSDVIAQPESVRGQTITFSCIFHGPDEVYVPYFVAFTPERHQNFAVWPDGAPLWEERAFQADLPTLYLERNHPQRDVLLRLAPFTRIEVTGKVKDVYRDSPFIEIAGFRMLGGTLGEGVVRAMMAGDQYALAGDRARAETSYRRALSQPSLDEVYAAKIRKRLADLLRAGGRHAEADRLEQSAIVGAAPPPAPPPAPAPLPPPLPPSRGAQPLTTDLPGVPVDSPPLPPPPVVPTPLPDPSSPAPAPRPLPPSPPAPTSGELPAPRVVRAGDGISSQPASPPPPALLPPPSASVPSPPPAPPPPNATPSGGPPPSGAPPPRVPRLSGVR